MKKSVKAFIHPGLGTFSAVSSHGQISYIKTTQKLYFLGVRISWAVGNTSRKEDKKWFSE